MSDRPLCKINHCNNKAKAGHITKSGTRAYMGKCHKHLTEKSRLKAMAEIISPDVKPNSYSRPFRIWTDMRRRCNNKKRPEYKYYGGRGITFDKRWESFALFWQDMGKDYQAHLELDRINNDGDYTPDNCRWATRKEQVNNASTNRILSFNNKTMTLSQWSELTGIKRTTISMRLNKYKWDIEKTLTKGAVL